VIGSQVTPACIAVNGQQQWAYGQIGTANFFELLGVQLLAADLRRRGRSSSRRRAGGVERGLWRRRFGADPDVVGRTVAVNRRPFKIVGVVPKTFRGTMSALVCVLGAAGDARAGGELRLVGPAR
jgi:hypothetical protein